MYLNRSGAESAAAEEEEEEGAAEACVCVGVVDDMLQPNVRECKRRRESLCWVSGCKDGWNLERFVLEIRPVVRRWFTLSKEGHYPRR